MLSALQAPATKYLGIPYVEGGASFEGVDCWGLAGMFLERETEAIRLPSLGTGLSSLPVEEIARLEALVTDWHRVDAPYQSNDVLIFRLGRLLHCGVMLDHEKMLNAMPGCGAVVLSIRREAFQRTMIGAYRHDSQRA